MNSAVDAKLAEIRAYIARAEELLERLRRGAWRNAGPCSLHEPIHCRRGGSVSQAADDDPMPEHEMEVFDDPGERAKHLWAVHRMRVLADGGVPDAVHRVLHEFPGNSILKSGAAAEARARLAELTNQKEEA